MNKIVIVGSGLAAVSAAKVISSNGIVPLIIDTFDQLENNKKKLKNKLKNKNPSEWKVEDLDLLVNNKTINDQIPKKLYMGSDFFYGYNSIFNNVVFKNHTKPSYSYAYGGLANGWGSAILPLDNDTLKNYPINFKEMMKSYKEVLETIPYSAVDDGLSKKFQIIKRDTTSINLNKNLENLKKKLSTELIKNKFIFGHGRFLCDSRELKGCNYCGNCMSGCVYDFIYKPDNDFKELIANNKVKFLTQIKVTSYKETDDHVKIYVLDKENKIQVIKTEKLIIAAGALPSAQIFMNSKKIYNKKIKLKTKNGFVLPVYIKEKYNSKWLNSNTLAGIFLQLMKNDNIYHGQISSPNEIIMQKLTLGAISLKFISKVFFNSFLICHGNLNSVDSDHYTLELTKHNNKEIFQVNHIKSLNKKILKNVISDYSKIFSKLNYFPIKLLTRVTDSQHTGGSLPMSKEYKEFNNTNNLGLTKGDRNTHFVDSSILPELPSYPIGLTIMANANYISKQIIRSVK